MTILNYSLSLVKLSCYHFLIAIKEFFLTIKEEFSGLGIPKYLVGMSGWFSGFVQKLIDNIEVISGKSIVVDNPDTAYPELSFVPTSKVQAVVRIGLMAATGNLKNRFYAERIDIDIAKGIIEGKSINSEYIIRMFKFFNEDLSLNDEKIAMTDDLTIVNRWYLYGGIAGKNWVATQINIMRNRDAQKNGKHES